MKAYDIQYKQTIQRILDEGVDCPDRTGVGVRKVFDVNISVDVGRDDNLSVVPLTTLRKVFPRTPWMELFWMLSGSTNANLLKEKNIKIWDGNTTREYLDNNGLTHLQEGFGGKIYGHQFRSFNGHTDQLLDVYTSLRVNPNSRRHFISLWNPSELKEAALPPCHVSYQFVVLGDTLNLKFYQRSSDFILAGNVNFTFATFFLQFMAKALGYKVGRVSHSIGDCHIYSNHLEVAEELVQREIIDHTATFSHPMDNMSLSAEIENLTLDEKIQCMFSDQTWDLVNSTVDYQSHPAIARERLFMAA